MAIRTRGKRKIVVGNRTFVWHIRNEWDSQRKILVVSSVDKKFIVHYRLEKSAHEPRFLRVVGREFYGKEDGQGAWKMIRCPSWEESSRITPKSVRRLIDWCFDETETRRRIPMQPR